MKQALTEALAYLEREFGPTDNWPDGDPEWIEFAPLAVAARLVERLLPGVCENCGGTGSTFDDPNCYACTCPVCHGSGQVWDEGIVEAVKAQVGNTDHWEFDSGFGCWTEPSVDAITLAVLSALVELLTEKAGVADRPVLDSIEGVDPSEYSIELSTQPSRLPE